MGIRGGLTELTPEMFRDLVAGEQPHLPEQPRYSLDKSWSDFHHLFQTYGTPLSLSIAGDFLHPASPHSLDDFLAGGREYYFGLVSPSLVQQVAEALAALSEQDLFLGEDADCSSHCESHLSVLKAAYSHAAATGNALMVLIS